MFYATKFPRFRTLILPLVLLSMAPSRADVLLSDDTLDRASLTQATLELQRDLLLAEERHSHTLTGLALYLSVDDSIKDKIQSIGIALGGETILQQPLSPSEADMLADGGMKRLDVIALPPGRHELRATISAAGKNVTKTIDLDKSAGRDHLKISITTLPIQRTPEIVFTHEQWTAAK